LLEEGVFTNADAVNARETYWMHDKRSSLNEGYTQAMSPWSETCRVRTEAKEEQTNKAEGYILREYMLHIQELRNKVDMLEMQIKTIQSDTTGRMNTATSTRASSMNSPESFQFSDDDMEADTPPDDLPDYDLSLPFGSQTKGTNDMFKVLEGKIEQEDIDELRQHYTKAVRLGKHMQAHPIDEDAKVQLMISKEELANKAARLRLHAAKIGFDQPCLRLLDTIEKEARIGNNMKKKAKQWALVSSFIMMGIKRWD
jgi:hypothetical protein